MRRSLAARLALALWLHPAAARAAAASEERRSLHEHRWPSGSAPAR
jgi:hypothetical protein